jgi:hypothetical protein
VYMTVAELQEQEAKRRAGILPVRMDLKCIALSVGRLVQGDCWFDGPWRGCVSQCATIYSPAAMERRWQPATQRQQTRRQSRTTSWTAAAAPLGARSAAQQRSWWAACFGQRIAQAPSSAVCCMRPSVQLSEALQAAALASAVKLECSVHSVDSGVCCGTAACWQPSALEPAYQAVQVSLRAAAAPDIRWRAWWTCGGRPSTR